MAKPSYKEIYTERQPNNTPIGKWDSLLVKAMDAAGFVVKMGPARGFVTVSHPENRGKEIAVPLGIPCKRQWKRIVGRVVGLSFA